MRWDRALNFLIIVFLCTNIFLGAINYQRFVTTYQVSDRRIDSVISILDKKGIKVQADLPRSFAPKGAIWLQPIEITSAIRDRMVGSLLGEDRSLITITKDVDGSQYGKNVLIYSMGEEQVKFYKDKITYAHQVLKKEDNNLSYKEALKLAKSFLDRINLGEHFKEVKIDYRSESYGACVTYYEVYRGLPIFDSFVKMKISSEGVFEAEIKCLDITDKMGEVKPLYAIDQILFTLQDLQLEETTKVIESVELGYRLDHSEGMHILSEEAVPMYKIQIKGLSKPVFVNAYTNTYEEILFISQD